MNEINLKARAKINISLDVTGKRKDGYHDVLMVMQTVNLFDKITIRKIKKDDLKIKTNLAYLPTDNRNLVHKVIQHIKEIKGIKTGLHIELFKVIPVSAGLGGGSSDAAMAILGMNSMFRLNMELEEMMAIGLKFGADIPYCLIGGTALAEGIGEQITKLPNFPYCYVVLAKPGINVSTPYVYQHLNLNTIVHPETKTILDAIELKDLQSIGHHMHNVLEDVTIKEYPIIQKIKEDMIQYGALGAMMSGSGPTVFGLFDNKKKAYKTGYQLKYHNYAKFIYTTTIYNRKR